MLDGRTLRDAHYTAVKTYGRVAGPTRNRPSAPEMTPGGARFEYRLRTGIYDVVLISAGILNGGFEEGLNHWNGTGCTRVIPSLTPMITPREGNLMSMISTGVGFGSINNSNSTISQQFQMPIDAQQITFQYNWVSEEPMEWIDQGFNDHFKVYLIAEDGAKTILLHRDIDSTDVWLPLPGDIFPGRREAAFHTGWQTVNYHIPVALRGRNVTIRFRVEDVGDNLYTSAALIDDVRIIR